MAYTEIDDPSAYFQTTLYTGNGGTLAVTNGGNSDLQQDWTWIKERTQTESHFLFDTVRGDNKYMNSNGTGQEYTESGGMAFNSDGFTLGSWNSVNESNIPYVSWNWKAGTSFTNDASGTGIGSIDSAGSVNQDAGFSICSFTGTGSNGTVKHGLNSAPSTIIYKRRNASGGWVVWHKSIGTNIIELNETGAAQSGSSYINGTIPTNSVFSVGTSGDINASGGTYIAYCFGDVQGFSKMGSYTGNGSNSFIYTGFKVGWLLVKVSDGTNGWLVIDAKRSPANPQGKFVYANTGGAEGTVTYGEFFSNGFGWKGTNSIAVNQSGKNYIYYAIAENPFVTSTGIPTTAR